MKWPLLFLISIYRKIISPLLPASCRFHPTCSAYAQEALQVHGFFKGGGLMIRRICRCHPWNPGGVDPVPPTASNPSTRSLSEKHSD